MEWLLRDAFQTAGAKQSHSHEPTDPQQHADIADGAVGQHTIDFVCCAQVEILQLHVIPARKMVDVQIFVAPAFGKPEYRHLDPDDFVDRRPSDSPARPNRLAGDVASVLAAKLDR